MAEQTPDVNRLSPAMFDGFQRRIGAVNLRGARIAGTLGALLVPAFALVDYLVVGPLFSVLLTIRILVAAWCIGVIFWTFRKGSWRYAHILAGSVMVVVGLAIAVMVHMHDAVEPDKSPTPYYAGLILVVVGAAQLCTWRLRQSIGVMATIYLSYLLPTLLTQPPASPLLYVAHNFFLVSTMIIAVVGQHFEYRLQLREFLASSELATAIDGLESANEKLKELDRYKTQFFSNITHELKTPLTLILAPTEAVLKGEMGDYRPEQQDFFRRIYQNGLRLMKLINDLLDLAKLEDSKLKIRVSEMEVNEFVTGLLSNIRPLAERKRIELYSEMPDSPVMVWADRDRLEQVFINLLANAVKFTPEEGRIGIRLTVQADEILVVVADTGIGIPEDKLELVFDRFSQVDGTTTRRFGGTGIGLALARELTQLHGGRIWAESKPASGTRMHVMLRQGKEHFDPQVLDRRQRQVDVRHSRREDDTSGLPQWSARFEMQDDYKFLAIDDATERRLAPRDSAPAPERSGARILVVEDSREMLQFIHLQLKDRYTVYLAENGSHGWDLVEKLKPDLVVTDYMMPVMDGLELTQRIKQGKDTGHIPVVMLTAKAGIEDRVAGKEAGADEYLAKPFNTAELHAVIRALLRASADEADRLVSQRLDSIEIVAGRLAHEIHNPLNYLKNGALLVGKSVRRLQRAYEEGGEDLDRKRDKALKSIDRLIEQITVGAERISGTVDLLKEYAREGYSPEERFYDVNAGVQSVLDVVRPTDGIARNVVFHPGEDAGEMLCVPQEFHEIVSNLVQNAFDATEHDGVVTIASGDAEGFVHIEVTDTGEGIPADVVDKIFSPFFTTKEPGRGMGMGLTIVFRLVKKHDGRIDVYSEPGKGTRFVVRLPRRLDAA